MPTAEQQRETIHKSLTNQPPMDSTVVDRFEALRVPAKVLADAIVDLCPQSREQSLALTHLEETVMWAVKSIAVHQQPG